MIYHRIRNVRLTQSVHSLLVYRVMWASEDSPRLKQGSEMEGVWVDIRLKDSISQWARAGQKITILDASKTLLLPSSTHHHPSICMSVHPAIHPIHPSFKRPLSISDAAGMGRALII